MPASTAILGGSIFGGARQARKAAKQQQGFTYRQTKRAQQFQRKGENTAAQRKVLDLKAAGLNPILAASQGIPPAGGVSPGSGAAANIPNMGQSATSAITKKQELSNMRATQELTNAQRGLAVTQANKAVQETQGQSQVNALRAPAVAVADAAMLTGRSIFGDAQASHTINDVMNRLFQNRPASKALKAKAKKSQKRHSGRVITAPRISTKKMRKVSK